MEQQTIRLGIDVGGTHTDAVILRGTQVVAGVKSATTRDALTGITNAMDRVITSASIDPADIDAVMIGTTHFTNAIIERRNLDEVAVVRLALPATSAIPPLTDWPADLGAALGGHIYLAKGGYEFDGRPISVLDEDEITSIARDIADKGLRAIAISSVFGPIQTEMEQRAAGIIAGHCPGAAIVQSSAIGRLGLLERENAAAINAALLTFANHTVQAFQAALGFSRLNCPFFMTQNDGTLMNAELVKKLPVLTLASGPTNSMRGAAFLTGVKDAVVVDIGGTTSDVGALHHGFPRQAATIVKIGGVRTNFRMPDVFSIGLGGGSEIAYSADGDVEIGPASVGYELTQKAMIFGGSTLTASDIAVASGMADFGDRAKVQTLDPVLVEKPRAKMAAMLHQAVERSRISADPLPVIGVGGGSILMPDRLGDLDVVRPENFALANAIGAAIAQISGEIDRVYSLDAYPNRVACLSEAEHEARCKAVAAGALAGTLTVIEREDVPIAYLPGNATRVRVRVVGDLGAVGGKREHGREGAMA